MHWSPGVTRVGLLWGKSRTSEARERSHFSCRSHDIHEGVKCSESSSEMFLCLTWNYHCITSTPISFDIGLPLPPQLLSTSSACHIVPPGSDPPYLGAVRLYWGQSWFNHDVLQIFPALLLLASVYTSERPGSKQPPFGQWWCLQATPGQHKAWMLPWGTLCSGVGNTCQECGHVWFLSLCRAQGPLAGSGSHPAARNVLQYHSIAHL